MATLQAQLAVDRRSRRRYIRRGRGGGRGGGSGGGVVDGSSAEAGGVVASRVSEASVPTVGFTFGVFPYLSTFLARQLW